jgi:hypothetical protein
MTPYDSENLTEIVEQDGDEFIAIRSPDTPSTIRTIENSAAFRHARRPRNF